MLLIQPKGELLRALKNETKHMELISFLMSKKNQSEALEDKLD